MNNSRQDADDRIIRSSEQLLKELSMFAAKPDGTAEAASKAEAPNEAGKPGKRPEVKNDDGCVDVRISMDSMKATADFSPPVGNGRPLTQEDVASVLKQRGVKHGILWDDIRETIDFCNRNKAEKLNVVVARGRLPVDEIPAHYVVEESLLAKDDTAAADDEEVDFKERSPFTLVRQGQILARKAAGKPGEMGHTVLGNSLAFKSKKTPEIIGSVNVRAEKDAYVAACDGLFQCKGSSFWVNEILFVDTGVDYKTGHIDFPGDILIKGVVKDGFKINGGKSIICQSTLDAFEVTCKGDLIVQNGIIGRQTGVIRVGGRVKAKFIERCDVESNGRVEAKNSIVNSNINTLDKVLLGDRGTIIGGVIFALAGVETRQIGSEKGVRTEINCGVDFVVQKKLEWIKSKSAELFTKLKEIQNRIGHDASRNPQLAAMEGRLASMMDKLNEAARSLLFTLDRDEDAKVIVKGVVFPGTVIEICHVRYVVSHVLPRVVFSLNRRKGKVEIHTL